MILKANEDSWIAALHKDSAHIPSSWLSCYMLKPFAYPNFINSGMETTRLLNDI